MSELVYQVRELQKENHRLREKRTPEVGGGDLEKILEENRQLKERVRALAEQRDINFSKVETGDQSFNFTKDLDFTTGEDGQNLK